jgi:Glycosyl hydrolase family 99
LRNGNGPGAILRAMLLVAGMLGGLLAATAVPAVATAASPGAAPSSPGAAPSPAATASRAAPASSSTSASSLTPSPSAGAWDMTSVPLLAYYYIWYDTSSWDRAKKDLPALGPYSSDDAAVMRQHIEWAKAAGIDGFLVSWKNTTTLDKRLATLVDVARQEDFKLGIVYEGLDFSRKPLPASQIAEDLDYFTAHYAADPVFRIFDKPLVIWSGTWEFSTADIASVAGPRRDQLLILASEKSPDAFARIASLVDGDAYYWSSVDPYTMSGYQAKLTAMSAAVHDAAGLWIAPAAPGFDARLIGGTNVVDRKDGQTLSVEMNAALHSFPDAIGIISWNEFSENSYIEPSRTYGDRSLQVLAGLRKTNLTTIEGVDSSSPGGLDPAPGIGRLVAVGLVVGIGAVGTGVIVRRRRPRRRR